MNRPSGRLRIALVGAGYFAPFHMDAWQRIAEAEVVAICDLDHVKAMRLAGDAAHVQIFTGWERMLREAEPDVVDIISPPSTHAAICFAAAASGIHAVCQKPLTPSFQESKALVEQMSVSAVRFMVHENWRWQPWYRAMKKALEDGAIGLPTHMSVMTRLGDGWGATPYSPRQPFFREYPRLLLYETGVHFFDTFRFLFGEPKRVYATIRQTNPLIAGEDAAVVHLLFRNGVTAVWDASRYAEATAANPRLTFGEMRIDGLGGSINLSAEAVLHVKHLGEAVTSIPLEFRKDSFAGDCVFNTQRHFIDQLLAGAPFESEGRDYLKSLSIVEAAYRSAAEGVAVSLDAEGWD